MALQVQYYNDTTHAVYSLDSNPATFNWGNTNARLYSFLFRTDTNQTYIKTGPNSQNWTLVGGGSSTGLQINPMIIGPEIHPPALPSVPAVTFDWDVGGAETTVIVECDINGSIVAGLIPGAVFNGGTAADAHGETRIIRNMSTVATTEQGNLILLQDAGGTYPFHLDSRIPWLTLPNLASMIIQFDGTDGKWHVVSMSGVAGTAALPRAILPAALPLGATDNWDPVDATTGLSFRYVNWIKIQGDAGGSSLSGIVGTTPAGSTQGQRKLLTNFGGPVTLDHFGASAAGNQFACPGAVPLVLGLFDSTWITYEENNGIWIAGT